MIARRHNTTRKRTDNPELRGMQDAVIYGFPKNPYRYGTDEARSYTKGYAIALHSLEPAYVTDRIPADGKTKGNPVVWAGPQPRRRTKT